MSSKIRSIAMPEELRQIDLASLEYVDEWAYAKTEILSAKLAIVFFVLKENGNKNLSKYGSVIKESSHISIFLPIKYAQTNEEIFKKGIKKTINQLAFDGFFEAAIDAIPTHIWNFDKEFLNTFLISYYDAGIKKNHITESNKAQIDAYRIKQSKRQINIFKIYDQLKNPTDCQQQKEKGFNF